MRAVESRYSAEHHMASVNLIFDDEQTAYLRELSEKMNLDFGEFIPHATLINVTEQDIPRLKLAAAALPSLDKLVLDGVNFLPDEAGNCVWVELRVQKTSWMVEVRRKPPIIINAVVEYRKPPGWLKCVGSCLKCWTIFIRGWISMDSVHTLRLGVSRLVHLAMSI